MKKIFFFIVLSFFLSFNSYAEWTEMSESVTGDKLYLDRETLKIVDEKRYFLYMHDYAIPNKYGDLSSRSYRELNCNSMMFKDLIKDYFSLPFAKGNKTEGSGPLENPKLRKHSPDSSGENFNTKVCKIKD